MQGAVLIGLASVPLIYKHHCNDSQRFEDKLDERLSYIMVQIKQNQDVTNARLETISKCLKK